MIGLFKSCGENILGEHSMKIVSPADRNKRYIRAAVLGTGRIGSSLENDRLREKPASHAGAISHNRETLLVAGADPDADARAAFAKRWKLPATQVFESAETLLATVHPDLVHISCDTKAHIPLLLSCLEKHVPVIVLEKPIGSTLEEARSALPQVQAAEKNGTSRVIVNHERRFAADYRQLREIIQSEELGALRAIHSRLYMGKTKMPAQVLWHDGTHLVDIISFLAGSWDSTAVYGNAQNTENSFLVTGASLQKENPVLITIDASPGRDFLAFELDCEFTRGRIRAGNGIWEEWESAPSPFYESFRSLRRRAQKPWKKIRKTGYFANMIAHAVDCFRDPATPAQSSFEDGLKALEILDRIISS